MTRLARALLLAACLVLMFGESRAQEAPALPTPDHVVVVVLENKDYGEIIGSPDAPYINSLAATGASFTDAHGVTHPSQPNYLDLFSGDDQDVILDFTPSGSPFTAPNLGSELIAAGRTFGGYSEDLPSVGFTGDSSGAYAKKHNPWADFSNVPASDNLPFTSFPTDYSTLSTVSFVIPNLNHDMHDGTIADADAWLNANLSAYAEWAKTHNSLLIVTWDENDDSLLVGPLDFLSSNHIPTIFVGQMVAPGTYSETLNHFNTLRTLEDMYGLPHAGSSASAAPILDVWTSSPPAPTTPPPPAPPACGLIGLEGFVLLALWRLARASRASRPKSEI